MCPIFFDDAVKFTNSGHKSKNEKSVADVGLCGECFIQEKADPVAGDRWNSKHEWQRNKDAYLLKRILFWVVVQFSYLVLDRR